MNDDLSLLKDEELASLTRAREIAFQNALGEVARRAAVKGIPDWSERNVAEQIAMKRADVFADVLHLRSAECNPPPLFRMGYEWAALSLVTVLESILKSPSAEICLSTEFQHVGKGFYKKVGQPTPSDPRRRAAKDLLDELEAFSRDRQRGMFFTFSRKSDYAPADDAALNASIASKSGGLSGALFQ